MNDLVQNIMCKPAAALDDEDWKTLYARDLPAWQKKIQALYAVAQPEKPAPVVPIPPAPAPTAPPERSLPPEMAADLKRLSKAKRERALTEAEENRLDEIGDSWLTDSERGLIAAIAKVLGPLQKRVSALESALESVRDAVAANRLCYRGTYDPSATYQKSDICTDRGSAWIALSDNTRTRPGVGGTWMLMVKAGRDGRDAKP